MSLHTKIEFSTLFEEEKWKKMLENIQVSVYMTWEYCNFFSAKYNNDINLLKISNDKSSLILCYTSRSKINIQSDIYSIYGFGGLMFSGEKNEHLYRELSDYLQSKSVTTTFLMIHPKDHNDFFIENYRTTYVVDLKLELDELWKKIHSNHKYEINRFKKANECFISFDKNELFNEFKILYKETITRVSASSVYDFSDEELHSLFMSPLSFVSGMIFDDKIQCVVIFLTNHGWSEYFINASTEIGRVATRLLIWESIIKLKESGVKYLNLGGGVAEGDQLDSFKRRFGGDSRFSGIFKSIINQTQYNSLCEHFKVDLSTNYFPSYWKK